MEHQHESLFADPRFWVGAAVVIFFLIFGRKFWSAITSLLDKRAAAIRAELDEAARLRREAEIMLADAKTRREAALLEAETMLANARGEAVRMADSARQEAALAATRRERMALERITAAEKAAVTEVRLAAADIAARAAGLVLAEGFGAEADSRLIDGAIQNIPGALAGRRAA